MSSRNDYQKYEDKDGKRDYSKESKDPAFATLVQLNPQAVFSVLKSEGKSESEIKTIMDKVQDMRQQIHKFVRKFKNKLDKKYGHLSEVELLKKGIKFAAKYNMSDLEKNIFINMALKNNLDLYSYDDETRYSPMASFLGMDQGYQMLKLQPKDDAELKEIIDLYNEAKHLHYEVKNQSLLYADCDLTAITGKFSSDKHIASASIHPVIVALFCPKVKILERLMVIANIGRLIIQRLPPTKQNGVTLGAIESGELEADQELALNIVNDPNTLAYFNDTSPLTNLIKRFKCQIELWKNILNLRQGRYYSTNFNFSNDYSKGDGITGFLKTIANYEWTLFDTPNLYHQQDEGVILKKLLSIFSFRPTFTNISSYNNKYGMGQASLAGLARNSFINLPVANIRLPPSNSDTESIRLENAINQTEWLVENRMLVPKNKSVIYSRDVIFFYVDRRDRTPTFINPATAYRYVAVPAAMGSVVVVNETQLIFNDELRIGKENFLVRSIVLAESAPNMPNVITSLSTSLLVLPESIGNYGSPTYINYNPTLASLKILNEDGIGYRQNTPFTWLPERSFDDGTSFKDSAFKRGTIFMFVKVQNE